MISTISNTVLQSLHHFNVSNCTIRVCIYVAALQSKYENDERVRKFIINYEKNWLSRMYFDIDSGLDWKFQHLFIICFTDFKFPYTCSSFVGLLTLNKHFTVPRSQVLFIVCFE